MFRRATVMLLVLGLSRAAFAFEEDLKFVEGLTAEGFPNLARIVLNRTLNSFPEAEKSAPELRIRILIAEKKFEEAAQQIRVGKTSSIGSRQSAISNQESLWLFLADTACRARQFPDAESAYKNYFESGAKADDATMQAAVNYGELLEQRGERAMARKIYEQVLKVPDIGKSARPVKVKFAHLLIAGDKPMPADLDRAKKLCEAVQLGGLDLWFGQAVITWSQIMILKEEWGEAQSVLETQMELLKGINDVLEKQGQPVSLISPLAGTRYLLGACYEHAGKKKAALVQFYNVYVQYGDSEWGPQAQERAQALKNYFEGLGKTVKIDLGANLSKMEERAFRVARRLFFDKQYADAAPAYLEALNKYPEGDESVAALRELTLSYISLNDPLSAKTLAAYTGERFASREAAADALLAAGNRALDEKQTALAWWMYDRYFEFFPQHSRAPAVLYSLAELKDGHERASCWNRIIENYPDSPYAARALGRLAWDAYEKEDYPTAAGHFEKYIGTETDSQKQTRARFALAESYRFSSDWKKALENFQILEKALNRAAESYGVSDEALKLNRPFIEKSLFYQGTCLAKLGETESAVQTFARFIATFQTSEFVLQAQLAKGSALIELRRYDDALAAFATFDKTSDRKFLEPALYYRGQALFETGRYSESIQTLDALLSNWPESAFYFEAKLVQGRSYAANGQNSDAVRALSDILSFATDDLLLNRAGLELGRAQTAPAEKLASFQRVALLADPDSPEQAPLIAAALYESLPLYLELSRPQDLLNDSGRLAKDFPMFGKDDEVNVMRTTAREQLARFEAQEEKKP